MYPCFCVFAEVAAASVVGVTLHHQTSFSASVVCLVPLGRAPPLHHLLLSQFHDFLTLFVFYTILKPLDRKFTFMFREHNARKFRPVVAIT
jgi:hypothetical protein